ncbi:hypothetical protein [Porticoccus sp.]
MDRMPLDNLVRVGQLKEEPPDLREFNGLVSSGTVRLKDAKLNQISLESRFDLAYNAAHALAWLQVRKSLFGISMFETYAGIA